MKVGVFPGKFIPFHRGHLTSILLAHSMVDKLYVVICGREEEDEEICKANGLPHITIKEREKWVSKELQGFDNIEVISFDEIEVGIEKFPFGWGNYAKYLVSIIPEKIEIIFGGEESYRDEHYKYFKNIEYKIIDPNRTKWPISATEIRKNPIKNWDFIVGSARDFFVKKVLITGIESCGKTIMAKKLAKLYNTSRSEEYGRFYSKDFLGGNEKVFKDEDFERICYLQREQDLEAIRTSNRVVFFDTDAVTTYYYNKLYLGSNNERILHYVNPRNYDLVLYLTPEVEWVDDGLRFVSDKIKRSYLDHDLYALYKKFGFEQIKIINGTDYYTRLQECIAEVDLLLV